MGNQHHGPPEPLQARPRRSPHEKAGLYCSRRNLIAGTRSLEQRLPFVTISADGPVYTAEELDPAMPVIWLAVKALFAEPLRAIIRIRSSW